MQILQKNLKEGNVEEMKAKQRKGKAENTLPGFDFEEQII